MEKILKTAGICGLFFILLFFSTFYLNTISASQINKEKNIEFSYFEDTSTQLPLKDVQNEVLNNRFKNKKLPDFNFGRSRSVFWIRLQAHHDADLKDYLAIYSPNVQDVQIYIPGKNGYTTHVSGWANSLQRDDEGLTYPVFRLNQNEIGKQAVYIRIQSEYTHMYSIQFYSEKELKDVRILDYGVKGFLFGMLLMVIMLHLSIFLKLRNKICLGFSLCVFLLTAHQGCNTGIYNILMPKYSNIIMSKSIEIGLVFLIFWFWFFMVLSDLRRNKKYDLCLKLLIVLCLFAYCLCMVDKVAANFLAHTLTILGSVFVFYISVKLYYNKQTELRLFLMSWNITMILYAVITLTCEGILNVNISAIKIPIILIAMVLICCFFSVSIFEHIREIQVNHEIVNQQFKLALEQVQRTETALLQTQIKPHFLYNSLTAIEQMCGIDSKKAQEAIGDFADYLRANIDFSVETGLIKIETELETVRHYLSLEKIRFGKRLTVTYDIRAEGFLLPPLIIQPIVENAVRHGVTKRPEGGTVEIVVEEKEEDYIIEIKDDGVGFDTEAANQEKGVHIGINNVRLRLKGQCHGELCVSSQVDEGTKVIIRIPKES